MKTLHQTTYLIFFSLLLSICYGQNNYQFDKIVKYTFSTPSFPNQERTNFFNSEDNSYHMQIYQRNDSLVAYILDTKKRVKHNFYVDESDSLKFYFIETNKSVGNETENKYEFSEIIKKKGVKKLSFKILNNIGKKLAKYKFTIKETDKSYFYIFQHSALETQVYNEIIPRMNFLVLESRGRNVSGRLVKYKLTTMEDMELSIEIPN